MLPPTPDTQQIAPPDNWLCTSHYGPAEEQVLAEVWRMLRRRKFLIVGCCVACLLLASLYVLLKSPRYEATARIEVSPAGTNSMGLDQMASRVLGPSDPTIQLQSAVTVLQSKTIALAVMKQLKMAERKDFAGPWVQPAGTSLADLPPEAREPCCCVSKRASRSRSFPRPTSSRCNSGRRTRHSPRTWSTPRSAVTPNEIFAAATTRPRWYRTGCRSRWTI